MFDLYINIDGKAWEYEGSYKTLEEYETKEQYYKDLGIMADGWKPGISKVIRELD